MSSHGKIVARVATIHRHRLSMTCTWLIAAATLATVSALPDELRTTLPIDAATGQPISLPDDDLLVEHLSLNVEEHRHEAEATCDHFHCGAAAAAGLAVADFDAYPMAPVPSIDFPASFAERDVIYVSRAPLFTAAECDEVIRLAELEGVGLPSTKSGKYQLGKAWIKDMPSVREWFNGALARQLFPTLSTLFPGLLPDAKEVQPHDLEP